MDDQLIIREFSELIKVGNGINSYSITNQKRKYFQTTAKNLIRIRFGTDSPFYKEFLDTYNHKSSQGRYSTENRYHLSLIGLQTGVLASIHHALKNGLTDDLFYQREILVFSDLLEQSFEFLDNGLNLAAGIYGRVVLETTIKEFATEKGIDSDLKFDQLIIKLRQENIINSPFEISLRANYKIGSLAAHGNEEFPKLTENAIKEFLVFIRDKVLTLK